MNGGLVRWHVTMSVDGFIAGPGDSMDFLSGPWTHGPAADEVVAGAGAVLVGRRSYEVGRALGQKVYGGAWSGPILVLTHRPDEVDDPDVRCVSGAAAQVVAEARQAAAGRAVVLIGADVARQCVRAGLVDDLLIHVVPVLLGSGVRLFADPDVSPVRLSPLGQQDPVRLPDLRYAIRPTRLH
ncbi:dihydrofolate reductase family protein [Micromonospora sp. NPDC047707]|uniref:dihydrofolate reductase family protein n=1 Tax=Micromonospora sp. NPDC047707 TaxID=3154498 RepID=UPI0034535170